MNIDKVTITGADDSTDIDWMCEVSRAYPFVEWGILISISQTGNPRFPRLPWMSNLDEASLETPMQLSMHTCGQPVRDICLGNWENLLYNYGSMLRRYSRIQLNFHAYEHLLNEEFYEAAHEASHNYGWQLIFQVDGVNDHLVKKARDYGIDAVPLFDKSGGAGIVPGEWPPQEEGIYSGYAGGLGHTNVLDEVEKISQVANGNIWIDMETRVRTLDDKALDYDKVESVLLQMAGSPYLQRKEAA